MIEHVCPDLDRHRASGLLRRNEREVRCEKAEGVRIVLIAPVAVEEERLGRNPRFVGVVLVFRRTRRMRELGRDIVDVRDAVRRAKERAVVNRDLRRLVGERAKHSPRQRLHEVPVARSLLSRRVARESGELGSLAP